MTPVERAASVAVFSPFWCGPGRGMTGRHPPFCPAPSGASASWFVSITLTIMLAAALWLCADVDRSFEIDLAIGASKPGVLSANMTELLVVAHDATSFFFHV